MNVLLIPEDFRNDQHVLKPLFVELFPTIGRPRARIDVLRDPLLGGVGEATKSRRLAEIVETYRGMTDVFILCVDRDGVEGRLLASRRIGSPPAPAWPRRASRRCGGSETNRDADPNGWTPARPPC